MGELKLSGNATNVQAAIKDALAEALGVDPARIIKLLVKQFGRRRLQGRNLAESAFEVDFVVDATDADAGFEAVLMNAGDLVTGATDVFSEALESRDLTITEVKILYYPVAVERVIPATPLVIDEKVTVRS